MAESKQEQEAKVSITFNGQTMEKTIKVTKNEPANMSISGSFDFGKPDTKAYNFGVPSFAFANKQPETADFIPLSKTPEPNIKLLSLRPRAPKRLASALSSEYSKVMKAMMAGYEQSIAIEPHENSIQAMWGYPAPETKTWWAAHKITIMFLPGVVGRMNPYHMFMFEHIHSYSMCTPELALERIRFFKSRAKHAVSKYVERRLYDEIAEVFILKAEEEVEWITSTPNLLNCYLVSVKEPYPGKPRIDMMREGLLDPRSLGPDGNEDLKIDPICLKEKWVALENDYKNSLSL